MHNLSTIKAKSVDPVLHERIAARAATLERDSSSSRYMRREQTVYHQTSHTLERDLTRSKEKNTTRRQSARHSEGGTAAAEKSTTEC